MPAITDADRQAAEELRVALADVSGFWHLPGDIGPICAALARHRANTERQILEGGERQEPGTTGLTVRPSSFDTQALGHALRPRRDIVCRTA